MKNKTLIYTIGTIFFILAMLITSVETVAFSKSFYQKEYHKLETADSMNMSEDDLFLATELLLDYIKDERDDLDLKVRVQDKELEMFNQKEKDHMIDVKVLFSNFNLLKNIFFGISLSILALSFIKKDIFNFMLVFKVIKNAILSIFSVLGILILYALIDFNGFWIHFHKLLFSNDLWLLNPATDRMINMFPESFFNQMVINIIMLFLGIHLCIGIIYYLFYRYEKRKEVLR